MLQEDLPGIIDHAWDGHAYQYPDLDKSGFKKMVNNIIDNPTEAISYTNGKTYFWDDANQTIIIHNSQSTGFKGTIMKPNTGYQYYLDEVAKNQ